jgi:hypothetical protein
MKTQKDNFIHFVESLMTQNQNPLNFLATLAAIAVLCVQFC